MHVGLRLSSHNQHNATPFLQRLYRSLSLSASFFKYVLTRIVRNVLLPLENLTQPLVPTVLARQPAGRYRVSVTRTPLWPVQLVMN